MNAKEKFKQVLAETEAQLARQPIADATEEARRRERWVQTVTPVIAFLDWLVTQTDEEVGINYSWLESSSEWTASLYLYDYLRDAEGHRAVRTTQGILKIRLAPESDAPYCWVPYEKMFGGMRCRQHAELLLNDIAEQAAMAMATFRHESVRRTRNT